MRLLFRTRRALAMLLTLTVAILSCETIEEPLPPLGRPQASSGAGREGELFGDLFESDSRINRSTTAYQVTLTPLDTTAAILALMTNGQWSGVFSVHDNPTGGRDWEWFDVFGDGQECLPGSTLPEVHSSQVVARESHCIVPGAYRVQLFDGDSLVRTIDIDFLGGKNVRGHERVIRWNSSSANPTGMIQWRLADEQYAQGMYDGILQNYEAGDTWIDWDVDPAPASPEPSLVTFIENVGQVAFDTTLVPSTQPTAGSSDVIRVDLSATAPAFHGEPGARLFRLYWSDGSGTRPLTRYYSAYGLYNHIRQISLSSVYGGGCAQLGVEMLLPGEAATVGVPESGITWYPIEGTGGCVGLSRPDLSVEILQAPSSLTSNASFPLTLRFRNAGAVASHATNYQVLVAPDPQPSWDAAVRLTATLPEMSPGQVHDTTVTVSAGTLTDPYLLVLAYADPERTIDEGIRANNIAHTAGLPVVGLPNLRFSVSPNGPTTFRLGSKVRLVRVSINDGFGPTSGPWLDGVFLSLNVRYNDNDLLLSPRLVDSALAANDFRTRYDSLMVPVTIDTGMYYLVGKTDETNMVAESNESDNESSTAPSRFRVMYATGVDMVPISVSYPASARKSASISFTLVIRNIGEVTARPLLGCQGAKIYLSADTLKSGNDRDIGPAVVCGDVISGERVTRTLTTWPGFSNWPVGQWYVLLEADSGGSPTSKITESDESNNILVGGTKITITQ